jgi:serine/threonine-protein kinase
VGSFKLSALIGKGGMGRVFLGINPVIGSRVAVKVMSDRASRDPQCVSRFINEARTVNMIRHHSVVKAIDLLYLEDGRPCIIMEFLRGASLGRILKRRERLPLGTLTLLTGQILEGLAAAHEQGVIHRDLKPGNIFVTTQGHAKLLDFGIAKLMGEPSLNTTEPGTLLGSLPYMAPEQINHAPVDERTDLFALSLVLYEAATGQKAYAGPLRGHFDKAPPRPSELRPDIPLDLERVILRGMHLVPEMRWQTAEEMAAALGTAANWVSADEWQSVSDKEPSVTANHTVPRFDFSDVETEISEETRKAVPRALRRIA